MPEITAYHESGHVWAALYYGAQVLRVTIEPPWDDGPNRYGDTQVAWPVHQLSEREFARKSALVALAGPVAEMIHLGQPDDVHAVAEWAADWQAAWAAMAPLATSTSARQGLLERSCGELFVLLNQQRHWHVLATLVDHLLAHETLDQEMIDDIVAQL